MFFRECFKSESRFKIFPGWVSILLCFQTFDLQCEDVIDFRERDVEQNFKKMQQEDKIGELHRERRVERNVTLILTVPRGR